jgi:hypothetical protein
MADDQMTVEQWLAGLVGALGRLGPAFVEPRRRPSRKAPQPSTGDHGHPFKSRRNAPMRRNAMSVNCRFTLDEQLKVIDAVNVVNSGKGYCHVDTPEDDTHLRERVLMVRLGESIRKLINLRPRESNEEFHAIWEAMLHTIWASQLNTFDPGLSLQHGFDGKLRRQKKHTQDFTSLALFRDDVECLLRDPYGDVESEALDRVVLAVFRVVQYFTKYLRPDLWKEHSDAEDLDYMFGIGLPEGSGISGSEWRRGMVAKADLINRVREVNANLSTFSEYTIEFAKLFAQQWDCSKEAREEEEMEWLLECT